MKNFRKVVSVCILSALLVSHMSFSTLAVDDITDSESVVSAETSMDESGGMKETQDISESSYDTESSDISTDIDTSQTQDTPESSNGMDSSVDDTSTDIDTSETQDTSESSYDTESSEVSDTSTDGDTSETQDISQDTNSEQESEIQKGKQKIKLCIDFNSNVLSDTSSNSRIDFSKVVMQLLSSDKKTVIHKFDVPKIMSQGETVSMYSCEVEVPSWGSSSDKYVLHFENLPQIYTQSVQDIDIQCDVEQWEYDGRSGVNVSGADYEIFKSLDVKQFNTLVFVYDVNYKYASNTVVDYVMYDSDDKIIAKGSSKTCSDGYAMLNIPTSEFKSQTDNKIEISVPNAFNNSLVTTPYTFQYVVPTEGSPAVYNIEADATTEEYAKDIDGSSLNTLTRVPINVSFVDAYDMQLFKSAELCLNAYVGSDVVQSLVLDNTMKESEMYFVNGNKYTLKCDSIDYNVAISPTTLSVSDTSKIDIVVTPQLSLKVINEENGVSKNAHFKITGNSSEYNEETHQFSVNYGNVYTVTNIDTNEVYDVLIANYKETVLNIADGTVTKNGYINMGSDNTNAGTPTGVTSDTSNSSEVTSVPKTGDIILSVCLTLVGLTGISFMGYQYFKRKGSKYNEGKD